MKHIGQVLPKVLHRLILKALANPETRPDVRRFLLEVLS